MQFHNGVELLLQRLKEGQRVRVLALSSGTQESDRSFERPMLAASGAGVGSEWR
jgi:hypothetical protein